MTRRPLNIQTPGAVAAAEPAEDAAQDATQDAVQDAAPVAAAESAEVIPPQESMTLAAERARIAKQAYLTPEGWVCPS